MKTTLRVKLLPLLLAVWILPAWAGDASKLTGAKEGALETQVFPLNRPTVAHLTDPDGGSTTGAAQIPVAAADASHPDPTATNIRTAAAMRKFFERSGIGFSDITGSSLSFDGSSIIVEQTPANLEKIRNILNSYNEVKQVAFEAAFIELNQSELEGLDLRMLGTAPEAQGKKTAKLNGSAYYEIPAQPDVVSPDPAVRLPRPKQVVLDAGNFDGVVRTLMQQTGAELLGSRQVIALSGGAPAIMTYADEIRYPRPSAESKGWLPTAKGAETSPLELNPRDIGIELKITPKVQDDDYKISLEVEPRATTAEGFLKYGGAGAGQTTPSGSFQLTRGEPCRVMLWDGSTLVLQFPAQTAAGKPAPARCLLVVIRSELLVPGGRLSRMAMGLSGETSGMTHSVGRFVN